MSRLAIRWLTLYLIHLNCLMYSLTQDLSQIKPTIERQRQIARIRNKILNTIESSGANISPVHVIQRVEPSIGVEPAAKEDITTESGPGITTHRDANRRSKTLVTLGEPLSQTKDCLAFNIRNYVKDVNYIVPRKIDLWIHIRKLDKKGKKKKARRKNRKRRHGRRIKIFISDGTKTLVKMRMRIRKTKWYKIELPISQFPDIISVNDSFKLCFKCKRCSKKIKLDLYRKTGRDLDPTKEPMPEPPTIPFLHFEEHRSQHIFRKIRSSDVKKSSDVNGSSDVINFKHHRHRHHRDDQTRYNELKDSCCREEIYTEEISKIFPKIVYPESFNITFCSRNKDVYYEQPLLSQHSTSQTPTYNQRCVPTSYETFEFVYVTNKFSIKHASIPHLIPVGCSCHWDI